MRWITEETEFEKLESLARGCVFIDSGREPTTLHCLEFDDADVTSHAFSALLGKLMVWSEDEVSYYTVLDPDPTQYYRRLFGRYPCIEIRQSDLPSLFLKALNEPAPNGNLADAIGINRRTFTITVPSKAWFVHALQSVENNGAHLWVPREWIVKIEEIYPYYQLAKVFH